MNDIAHDQDGGLVTLDDIGLSDARLETMPLIARLRAEHFETPTEVCIERARLITRYLKERDNPDEPAELMRANAVSYYLSRREPVFHDDNLIPGSTTSKRLGAPVYPELLGLTIWPELDTISQRDSNPQLLSPEEARELNLEIFPYWMDRTILEIARRRYGNPLCLRLMERIVFYISGKAGCISHCVPSYEAALHRGLAAVVAEVAQRQADVEKQVQTDETRARIVFYEAVRVALKGIMEYAARLAHEASRLAAAEGDPWRKANLETLAAICSRVPAKPARTLREAISSLWLCQVGIHAENINMAMSPGRLDQVLYPFYRRDVEENGLSAKEAVELGCCLWLKLSDNTNLVPETAERLWGGAGSTPAVTLGGIGMDGRDAVNDLTYILLRVTELMRLRDPSVNARYHYEVNDQRYRRRVSEVVLETRAIPAFHNDVTDIKTLVDQGVSEEHARDYAVVGCVELASTGRDYVASSSIMFNLASAMEMTLRNGRHRATGDEQIGPETGDPRGFGSFNELWEAFKSQLSWLVGNAVELNEKLGAVHQDHLPTPLLSAFFEGPLTSGRDLIFGGALYNSSGASHVAFPDVCDSLNAIEVAVFEDKRLTMKDLVDAVAADFQPPHDKHLAYLRNRTPKFGEDHPIAIKTSRNLVGLLYELYQSYTNYRGGRYRPAFWTMTTHAGQGKLAGALPSGRRAHEVFSSGITPASQAAQSLIAAFKAVAALPAEHIPGGEALNIKYTPVGSGQDREEYLKHFGDLVESYFREGGLQVQFNINTYETLIDAKEHPERYPEMIVRVSGYSAYFKDLNDAMKDELITRTQYQLMSGEAVPLPQAWKGE